MVVDLDDLALERRGGLVRCLTADGELLVQVDDLGDPRESALAAFDAVLSASLPRPGAAGLEQCPVALYNPYSDRVGLLSGGELQVFVGSGQLRLDRAGTVATLVGEGPATVLDVDGALLTWEAPALDTVAAAIAAHPDVF